MNYEVPQDLLQKLLDYLGTKPFLEVHLLVNGLVQSQPITKEETK